MKAGAGKENINYSDTEWFWNNTLMSNDPKYFPGNYLVLNPTANLLYLFAHYAVHHKFPRHYLIWLYDIHLLIAKWQKKINWHDFINVLEKFGWERDIYKTIMILKERFDTPFPPLIDEILQNTIKLVPQSRKIRTFFAQNKWEKAKINLIDLSVKGKVLMILFMIFPSFKYMSWRYELNNGWLIPFYYPYRWISFCVDGLRHFLKKYFVEIRFD
jgi:hypothetical protein